MEKEKRIIAPDGCEIAKVELVDGVAVVTFKPQERRLPKSWEEFCRMFPIEKKEFIISNLSLVLKANDNPPYDNSEKPRCFCNKNILPDRATAEAVLALCQLIQLRDCYNGEWVPDWTEDTLKYAIEFRQEKISNSTYHTYSCSPLYFKTNELRDEFLRNFRPLIEKLKPLYGIKEGGEE